MALVPINIVWQLTEIEEIKEIVSVVFVWLYYSGSDHKHTNHFKS